METNGISFWLPLLLGNGAIVALIGGLFKLAELRSEHRHTSKQSKQMDIAEHIKKNAERIEQNAGRIDDLLTGQKIILQDCIKRLARSHFKRRFISLDDLQYITEMHQIYHDVLGGHALDDILTQLRALPMEPPTTSGEEIEHDE